MASGGLNDCNSQLNDSIDKSKSKKHSSEHEETIKSDQMAAKKFDEKVSWAKGSTGAGQFRCHTVATCCDERPSRGTAWNCTFLWTELVFSPYFLQLFLLILWVGKRPHSLPLHLFLPSPMTMSFFIGHFSHEILTSCGWPMRLDLRSDGGYRGAHPIHPMHTDFHSKSMAENPNSHKKIIVL